MCSYSDALAISALSPENKDPVKDKPKRFGLFDQFGEDSFFATIGAAVDEFRGSDVPE